jgi:hypothetical protein
MKINSIGINAYRQAMEKPNTESQMLDKSSKSTATSKVEIPGQAKKIGSNLAVKLKPGTFVDMLSTEEKEALTLLFEKFKESGALDGTYRREGESGKAHIGNFVDVKL